jgi:hypothetical protein
MDATLIDLTLTGSLAALLLVAGGLGIAALPWRAVQVAASARAWQDLSVLSGGFARDGLVALRGTVRRLGEAASRRPSAALTRTLS